MMENMEKIAETMTISISEVFERMFFIFLEPPEEECSGYDMEAAIRFGGPLNGEVRILLSQGMAQDMMRNMLGMDEEEMTPQAREDCAKEAANMVCGDFLSKLDSNQVFSLSVPVFRPQPENDLPGQNTCRMDFVSDGNEVGVIVVLD